MAFFNFKLKEPVLHRNWGTDLEADKPDLQFLLLVRLILGENVKIDTSSKPRINSNKRTYVRMIVSERKLRERVLAKCRSSGLGSWNTRRRPMPAGQTVSHEICATRLEEKRTAPGNSCGSRFWPTIYRQAEAPSRWFCIKWFTLRQTGIPVS